jgi:hypothetical protein
MSSVNLPSRLGETQTIKHQPLNNVEYNEPTNPLLYNKTLI